MASYDGVEMESGRFQHSLNGELFASWLQSEAPCASVMLRYAQEQLSDQPRGSITPDAFWDIVCCVLERPCDDKPLDHWELAQCIVYWLDEGKVPAKMCQTLYSIGMVEDLLQRGTPDPAFHDSPNQSNVKGHA